MKGQLWLLLWNSFLHGGALIYSSQEIGHEAPINFLHIHPWIGPNVRIFIKNMGV